MTGCVSLQEISHLWFWISIWCETAVYTSSNLSPRKWNRLLIQCDMQSKSSSRRRSISAACASTLIISFIVSTLRLLLDKSRYPSHQLHCIVYSHFVQRAKNTILKSDPYIFSMWSFDPWTAFVLWFLVLFTPNVLLSLSFWHHAIRLPFACKIISSQKTTLLIPVDKCHYNRNASGTRGN